MATLSRELRRTLENTVAAARAIAEAGAEQALRDQFAVPHHEPWPSMTLEERALRSRLRAHARQLGDRRDGPRGAQTITHLTQACAYEHWHRMLFARFLAENDLLLDPEYGMAMSLDEVQERARECNADWLALAADFAQRMLLDVFRTGDPVLEVPLPPEKRQQLEKLTQLPREIFVAEDSLGWVYQFWQRDQKEAVNKSEVKIGADELAAVTQLFTEDYMVLFLLENTLGAWWTARRGAPDLPGYTWTYLRLNDDGKPAAGSFDGWPKAPRDLRVLDPCMGSGHFLTFALPILARMRGEEEGLSLQEAVVAVLRDNLFGLELDARCSQIAAFNLAITAWRLVGAHCPLPAMNLACSGLGINAPEADWVKLAGEDGKAREEMRRLYSLFRDAPTLGSLIDPRRLQANVYASGAESVLPLLEEALRKEQANDETKELAIAAQGVVAAFRVLVGQFTLVATNVPYLGRGKQDAVLAQYCGEFHSDAKADLATCFVDRCLRFCQNGGSTALVTPQNWLFLTSYKKLRERLLKTDQWDFVGRLGPRAFETISGEVVNVALLGLTRSGPSAEHVLAGWDVGDLRTPAEKLLSLITKDPTPLDQSAQLSNPDRRLILDVEHDSAGSFAQFAHSFQGAVTGDLERFTAFLWEVDALHEVWEPFRTAVSSPTKDDGLMCAIRWQGGNGDLARYARETRDQLHDMHESGQKAWDKIGVAINRMRGLYSTVYYGTKFDNNVAVLIPEDTSTLLSILCFCQSEEFPRSVRNLDQTLKVTNQTFRKVAFDLVRWQRVAAEKYSHGHPKPHSDDPRQWLFNGHPKGSDHPLQVAVARLVGYRWPRQTGSSFPDCPALQPDGLEAHADADGIVCLSSLAGEAPAADRLRTLLADAFGSDWSAAKLAELLGDCDSIELWLRDGFFAEHCDVFHSRPFVWHVWDGRRDGFHALVNYHKLAAPNGEGKKNLERLIYTALGDWISRQRAEVGAGVDGADARLSAALHLQGELEKILLGEAPYDIFVRWKPIHEQPIGWEPEINDGVRLNIRPWLTAKPYQPSRKEACILRVTPRIHYGKDRGKEPHRPKEEFPWFWKWDERAGDFPGGKEFDGARWNDLHYSLAEKRKARERQGERKELTR